MHTYGVPCEPRYVDLLATLLLQVIWELWCQHVSVTRTPLAVTTVSADSVVGTHGLGSGVTDSGLHCSMLTDRGIKGWVGSREGPIATSMKLVAIVA